MNSITNSISVTVSAREAVEIINVLTKGVGDELFKTSGHPGAIALLDLLRANFQSSVSSIHTPKGKGL